MRVKSMMLTAPQQIAWIDEELREPGPHEVLVETLSGAISIGTELPHYLGSSRAA